jgi:ferric-dicitrate binding protein FerR (iron transport regulator)
MNLDQIKVIATQIGDAMGMPINPANVGQLNLKINRLTLMLAAACHASAAAERLLTYKEYVVRQSKAYQTAPAAQRAWILKKETRLETFYTSLTAKQYAALLKVLAGLTAILSTVS